MANCLVTKLKGVVNDDNLTILGGFTCNILETEGSVTLRHFELKSGSPITVELTNGLYFTNSNGDNLGNKIEDYTGVIERLVSHGTGKLIVKNKYGINRFNFNSEDLKFIEIPTSAFSHLGYNENSVNTLYIKNKLVGSLSRINNVVINNFNTSLASINGDFGENVIITGALIMTSCTSVNISSSKVSSWELNELNIDYTLSVGLLTEFLNPAIRNFSIVGCANISGSVESYAEYLWSHNIRETPSSGIILRCGGAITLHDNPIKNVQVTYYLVFTNSGVEVHLNNASGTTVATYNGSSWSYPS